MTLLNPQSNFLPNMQAMGDVDFVDEATASSLVMSIRTWQRLQYFDGYG